MVWSQYVYEATAYNDVVGGSDDDEYNDDTPLNIEDWEVQYSDELRYMWNMINTLAYDAHMNHSGEFCDFVEFCSTEHMPHTERTIWEYEEQSGWYEERLGHIWRNLRRAINENGLHEEMMRGATFNNFAHFAKNYMHIY
jgi:hypothetical protein